MRQRLCHFPGRASEIDFSWKWSMQWMENHITHNVTADSRKRKADRRGEKHKIRFSVCFITKNRNHKKRERKMIGIWLLWSLERMRLKKIIRTGQDFAPEAGTSPGLMSQLSCRWCIAVSAAQPQEGKENTCDSETRVMSLYGRIRKAEKDVFESRGQ